jgi:hypothetical protein
MENQEKTQEAVVTPAVIKKTAVAPKPLEVKASNVATVKSKKEIVIKNTSGKEVAVKDYFYKGVVPSGFEGTCGVPVDREDLLAVFNKVFKPEDNILFYKQADKEVYLVIVPIKYSISVGDFNDSMEGDFQKHAISFLNEGSVNTDTLRQKLERITKFVKYTDR